MSEHHSVAAAAARLQAGGPRYTSLFQHGVLELEFYQPRDTDPQQPHTRDEVYFVIAGSGWFVSASGRRRFQAGDAIYVAAGEPHRFEEFTPDFTTWAIFAPAG